jgi:hypothetical protein
MNALFSFLNKVFLIAGLIGFILGVISKLTDIVYFGIFPLSYMRFTGVCLLFVIAISLYQMAATKAPKKAAKKKK